MSTATAAAPLAKKTAEAEEAPTYLSKEDFLQEYAKKEDGYKYEWNDGAIEKTNAMNQYQSTIFFLLNRLFLDTTAFKSGGGLITETDVNTSEVQLRRPDISYFTGAQIEKMKEKENQVPPFLIEVISPTDRAEDVNKKLEEYFRAGVQVVWHIFPESQKVDVYASPDEVAICRGKAVCSAAPVIPDLEVEAASLFA